MKVVILQPSYIPWRGYFDQINRADLFIFYDDVQYDKNGWRNRNQIKTVNGKQWLTIPVHAKGVTKGVPIKDVPIDYSKPWRKKHLNSITYAYAKAPYFRDYQSWLETIYKRKDELLSEFTIFSTKEIAKTIGINSTQFMCSSEIENLKGKKTDRIIQILKHVGADHYISGPSAKDYIDYSAFENAQISLEFLEYNYQEYEQLHPPYDPYVSILDLMFMQGENSLRYFG